MARSHGGSKDAPNGKNRKKRTTVTTIETHEVWLIRGIPEGSGLASFSKEVVQPETVSTLEVANDPLQKKGEEHPK